MDEGPKKYRSRPLRLRLFQLCVDLLILLGSLRVSTRPLMPLSPPSAGAGGGAVAVAAVAKALPVRTTSTCPANSNVPPGTGK